MAAGTRLKAESTGLGISGVCISCVCFGDLFDSPLCLIDDAFLDRISDVINKAVHKGFLFSKFLAKSTPFFGIQN